MLAAVAVPVVRAASAAAKGGELEPEPELALGGAKVVLGIKGVVGPVVLGARGAMAGLQGDKDNDKGNDKDDDKDDDDDDGEGDAVIRLIHADLLFMATLRLTPGFVLPVLGTLMPDALPTGFCDMEVFMIMVNVEIRDNE